MYSRAHLLIRLGGHFGQSATTKTEQWSTGFRLGNPSADVAFNETALSTLVESIWPAALALHQNAQVRAGSNTFLSWVTGAVVGPDGKYLPATQETTRFDAEPAAGVGIGGLPWTAAIVTSLRTTRPRGICSNGRMYYPAVGMILNNNTGRVGDGELLGRLTPFKTFFDAVNDAVAAYGAGIRLVVASNKGAGDMAAVVGLRADNRLDNIERRENDVPPAYQSIGLSA